FPLPPLERDQGDLLPLGKLLDGRDEGACHLGHHLGRGKSFAAVRAKEIRDAILGLKSRLDDVEIHAVDRLDGERNMVLKDFGDCGGYTHGAGSVRRGLTTTAACRHNKACHTPLRPNGACSSTDTRTSPVGL